MAVGFPAKTDFATGDVLTATQMNDVTGTLNLLNPSAKGTIFSASAANTPAAVAIGANGTILMADSTAATGIKWDTGAYASYTPGSITGFTTGNGTVAARYRQLGKTVFVSATITLGSTSAMTGSLVIQFPVSANTANNGVLFGNVYYNDTGVASYFGRLQQSGANFFSCVVENTSITYNTINNTSALIPFTWATGDQIILTGTYEAA
jgi:hypothetical protein